MSANLDMIRAIAVLMVVACHLEMVLWGAQSRLGQYLGSFGVMTFFVHTCLVLMLSLQRRSDAAQFFVRRVFRIYPLAVAAVCVATLMQWAAHHPIPWERIVSNLLLVQNLTGHDSLPAPLWSLPYELQMYLVLPVLFLLVRRDGLSRIVGLMVASALIAWWTQFYLIRYVPCFLPGVLAYVLMRRVQPRVGAWVLVAVIAGGLCAALLAIPLGVGAIVASWVFCTALGAAIPFCRELTFRPVARASEVVARYSYSIYLTHMFAIEAAFDAGAGLPKIGQLALFVVALVALTRVCYRWIEVPGIALGTRIVERMPLRRVVTVTTSSGAPTKKAPDLAAEG